MGEVGDLLKAYKVGLTFTPGSPASLAERIIVLLNDPKLRMEMGRTARLVVLMHHSWEVKVNQLKAILINHFKLDHHEKTHVT
jgi:glycosyltransferase involved in cell wall biosynthesis